MRRLILSVLTLALLSLPAPSFSKGGYAYGTDNDPEHGFGWAVVSGENTSMSDMDDLDRMGDLKKRFGDEFLYIRDGRARYVIQDRGLMDRASQACESIQDYGKEVGVIASVKALQALSCWVSDNDDRRADHLDRRLEKATKRLEHAVKEVKHELREILSDAKERHLAVRL